MKNLLIIFTRNPELGKCKTRLAATVGDKTALNIYKFLLRHTVEITQNLAVDKRVYYSEQIWEDDVWDRKDFDKKLQKGTDLGTRMYHAFAEGFDAGYDGIIIIGSDIYDMNQVDLEDGFSSLSSNDFVIGPADDGGYYLLGMRGLKAELFQNKNWGTSSVLEDTLTNLENESVHLLSERNDIDRYEDIKDIEVFQQFLNT